MIPLFDDYRKWLKSQEAGDEIGRVRDALARLAGDSTAPRLVTDQVPGDDSTDKKKREANA